MAKYTFTDNPTLSGISPCNTDVLNDCIMHLKYNNDVGISNCLTEIPQRIKLELNEGTITLKAGSVVIVPNGFEADGITPRFDDFTIENDLTKTGFGTGSSDFVIFIDDSGQLQATTEQRSGNTPPSDSALYYNTTTNTIAYYSSGTITAPSCSLPLAWCSRTSGTITGINQIFKGMGYIGSTVWVDKGVKGLIPNGRNEDGSLKNIEFETENVLTYTKTSGNVSRENIFWISSTKIDYYQDRYTVSVKNKNDAIQFFNEHSTSSCVAYIQDENIVLAQVNNNIYQTFYVMAVFGVYFDSGFKVTSLRQIKHTFHAMDYNDYNDFKNSLDDKVSKSGDTMTGELAYASDSADTSISMINTNDDYSIAPSVTQARAFRLFDKNKRVLGDIRFGHGTNGSIETILCARSKTSGTEVSNYFTIGVDANGKKYYSPVQLINTYVSGTSGYNIWSNGYCEQWGVSNVATSNTTINLTKKYKDTNYNIQATNSSTGYAVIISKNVASIVLKTSNAGNTNWIVKGYLATDQY